MGVPSKNSSVLDMGRRPELKSDEFFEGTPLSSRDNCTFVLETAQESGSVIGGATLLVGPTSKGGTPGHPVSQPHCDHQASDVSEAAPRSLHCSRLALRSPPGVP